MSRELNFKERLKNKRVEKIFKNSLFFSVLAFLCFSEMLYSLLFIVSMRVIFALKIAAFFCRCSYRFLPLFAGFFVGVAPLRS